MRFDPIPGLSTAILFAGLVINGADAQTGTATSSATPTAGDGVIHLHMPGVEAHAPAAPSGDGTIHLHPIHHHADSPATASDADTNGSQPAATAEAAAPENPATTVAPLHTKASHAGAATGKAAIPFNFGEDNAAPPADGGTVPGAPMPQLKTASLPPHAGAHASDDEHRGLTKRGAVMFEKGATNPSPVQFGGVKLLAGDLTTALESGASRVQLEAYGGAPGDKSSDARRLSLKRALAVRQLLIDNGVPSNRIDVRAMGGVDDKGPTDRVDVFLRAG